jgi:TetR/AcrR family transcriptional repressor of nem operon
MKTDTRTALLKHAEFLIRTQGYSAFSYADLSESIGISKASIHHHFPAKEDLARALFASSRARFEQDVQRIEASYSSAIRRLRAYGELFLASFENGMLPFCCAVSVEKATLPASVCHEVREYFQLQIKWLISVIDAGKTTGELPHASSSEEVALSLLSALEGGSVIGWALHDRGPILLAFDRVLEAIAGVGRHH